MHDLNTMTGVFLKRGNIPPLSIPKKWGFAPGTSAGEKVTTGSWLGEVGKTAFPTRSWCPSNWKDSIPTILAGRRIPGNGNHRNAYR